jgi:hypothetical protein
MISFDACIASARPDSPDLKQFHNDSRHDDFSSTQPAITTPYFCSFFVTNPADRLIRCCEVITVWFLPRQSDATLQFEHPFSAELMQNWKHADWYCNISASSVTFCVSSKHRHGEIIPLKCFPI